MRDLIYKGIIFRQPDYKDVYENRKKTRAAILCGILISQPCEICGNKNTHPHHEKYSDYLNVRWLCKSCHSKIHGLLKGLRKSEEDNPDKLIIWSELSRLITKGDRNGIRPNKIPKKHEAKVRRLQKLIEAWQEWAGI